MEKANLNYAQPRLHEDVIDLGQAYTRDSSYVSEAADISIHFDNLEDALIAEIEKAEVIYGCVAWLTNERILSALATKEVSIVVQKEDFLRPDMNNAKDWKSKLRRQYATLKAPIDDMLGIHHGKLRFLQMQESAIRCAGNHNRDKVSAFPRMHHKFVVFCKKRIYSWEYVEEYEHEGKQYKNIWETRYVMGVDPYAVWTGSFNFTQNAVMSLENAVVIRKEEIARAYYREYGHVYSLSEPLDWERDWVSPNHDVQFIGS